MVVRTLPSHGSSHVPARHGPTKPTPVDVNGWKPGWSRHRPTCSTARSPLLIRQSLVRIQPGALPAWVGHGVAVSSPPDANRTRRQGARVGAIRVRRPDGAARGSLARERPRSTARDRRRDLGRGANGARSAAASMIPGRQGAADLFTVTREGPSCP